VLHAHRRSPQSALFNAWAGGPRLRQGCASGRSSDQIVSLEPAHGPAPTPSAAPSPAAPRPSAALLPIALLCLGGGLARALTAWLLPNIAWPDEIFQSTEQALRLLTGRGLTPWEFQIGARSWLLPGLAAPLLAAGRVLSADPKVALGLIAAFMIGLATLNVWSAYVIGAHAGRRLHGLLAAGLTAFWCELVYYSPHLLPDTISGALLLGALAAATRPERPRRLFWTGVLLGATLVVRPQLAATIGLIGLMACARDIRVRAPALAAGFALPVAALGALDWLTWGAPFHSLITYLKTNTGGVAALFGVDPPLAYWRLEKLAWGTATPLIVGTAALGAKRVPAVAVALAATALTFSAIGHKEPRFLYPALLLLFVICGVGTVELADDANRHLRAPFDRSLVLAGLTLLWAAASIGCSFSPALRPGWTHDADVLRALDAVNADAASCGIGLDAPDWTVTGFSRVRDDIQLYDPKAAPPTAYDYLLRLPFGPQQPLASYATQGFELQRCYGARGVCLYRRPGRCRPAERPLRAVTPARLRATLTGLGYAVY
jgi:hypothetical protein